MNPKNLDPKIALEDAENRLTLLEARLSMLESGPSTNQRETSPITRPTLNSDASRRKFFKLAGAVAVGGAASAFLAPQAASAADDGNLVIGAANTSSSQTLLTRTGTGPVAALRAVAISADLRADGIYGVSGSSAGSAGVYGESVAGCGLYGDSSTGYAIYGGGNGRIGMKAHTVDGPPSSGSYDPGDIVRDGSGNTFLCVASGTPGLWKKIGGPASAGQMHLVAPNRIYDTRPNAQMNNGAVRTLDLSPFIPVGASAALVSVGVFGPSSDGYLSLSASGTASSAINVYWSLPNTSIANTTITGLSNRRFDMRATLSFGTTNAFVDLLGYFA